MLLISIILRQEHIKGSFRTTNLEGGGGSREVRHVSYSRGNYLVIVILSCGKSGVHLSVKCDYAFRVLCVLIN